MPDPTRKESSVNRQHIEGVIPYSIVELARVTTGSHREGTDWKQSSRQTYSNFPNELSLLVTQLYMKNATAVLDPFAGWGERHAAVKKLGIPYFGFDTSMVAIKHAKAKYGVSNIHGNSLTVPFPTVDFVFTCPPYGPLEIYDSPDGLDRLKSWKDFLTGYRKILSKCCDALVSGGTVAMLVGDWRKNHRYFDLTFETERILKECGLTFHDKVIFSHAKRMNAAAHAAQAVRLGTTAKVHESLVVMKKL